MMLRPAQLAFISNTAAGPSRLLRSAFSPSSFGTSSVSPRSAFLNPFRPSLLRPAPLPLPCRAHPAFPSPLRPTMTVAEAAFEDQPAVKYLKDYKPPFYTISHTDLQFSLDDDGLNTIVAANLTVAARDPAASATEPLVLDGAALELLPNSLKVAGNVLSPTDFVHDTVANTLTISADHIPKGAPFNVESVVRIKPAKNTVLEGLYMSAGDYCTQCEAEGFRRITFYLDRPDVMAKFSVRVEADRLKYPVLLSNGNCIESGEASNGRHFAQFDDPFPKPCYLFALVAGDLASMKEEFITVNGRKVALSVFVKGQSEVPKCAHAMASLKRAMKWDEDTYGLEYNYDIFNIVAVPSFTFGAMENTSLNIFNSKYVLVSPETATDTDYNNVEGVVGHEYFHNYSGNRVTCSSWFQLSLKEGLTVFRDQSFSADMNSAAVTRISDVTILRSFQFAEDAGPMSHPIQPQSYITCNTFYTSTVYNKGAEVIRMLKTIVGPVGFRAGTDTYFSRHDGQAVTCDDWVTAIQDANPHIDLSVFRRWYVTSGTPVVKVNVIRNEKERTMTLVCNQSIPPTSKQPSAEPLFIPICIGLIAPDGSAVPVDLQDGTAPEESHVLNFDQRDSTFILHNVPDGTVPSLLRNFSAPVKLVREDEVSKDELSFLMANDSDEFNRWESGQKLILNFVLECIHASGDFEPLPASVASSFRKLLVNEEVDAQLRAQVLAPPNEPYVLEQLKDADPVRVREALSHFKRELATHLESELINLVDNGMKEDGEYKLDPASQGKRALKNVALGLLASLKKEEIYSKCLDIMRSGSNMTDVLTALGCLSSSESKHREIALVEFYKMWAHDYLVVDKWLRMQSTAKYAGVLDNVKELQQHPAYKESVPNCVYALLGGYGHWNVHMPSDGSGYKFLADQIIHLNSINPQVAARITRPFTGWRKFEAVRRGQMEVELKRIAAIEKLSKDVYEVVSKSLANE